MSGAEYWRVADDESLTELSTIERLSSSSNANLGSGI